MDFNNYVAQTKKDINAEAKQKRLQRCVILLFVLSFGLLCSVVYQFMQTNKLQQKLDDAKVYVYDLQDTLRGLRVDELNAEFEAKINILNHEVLTAQNKISSLKDANIQADFSDVYLNSLKNKRDTMIKEYNDTLQEITDRINQNLVQIAHEKNTPTIFNKQTIGAFTPDVIDITAEIVQRIQAEHINDMLK
ncbi:MAG: hypothetical protein IJ099_04695 [Alphaproteobacteria bacterium]|nr:hypothetical protein [Alphaproteobacteria bacterium]